MLFHTDMTCEYFTSFNVVRVTLIMVMANAHACYDVLNVELWQCRYECHTDRETFESLYGPRVTVNRMPIGPERTIFIKILLWWEGFDRPPQWSRGERLSAQEYLMPPHHTSVMLGVLMMSIVECLLWCSAALYFKLVLRDLAPNVKPTSQKPEVVSPGNDAILFRQRIKFDIMPP